MATGLPQAVTVARGLPSFLNCWPPQPDRRGRDGCSCHADPPKLHGPYWQWTRKVAARTVCRWLSPDQREDYQAWIDNDRRLRDLLTRLEALGAVALDADPRWKRRPGAARDRTSQTSP